MGDDQHQETKDPKEKSPVTEEDEEEMMIIDKVIGKLEPKMCESLKKTMLELFETQPKRKRDDTESSTSHHTVDSNDEVLSLFARDSFEESPNKKLKVSSKNSSKSNSNPSSSSGSRTEKLLASNQDNSTRFNRDGDNTGFNRDGNDTGFNRDEDQRKPDGEKSNKENELDMVEELLLQCEDNVQISDEYGPKIRDSIASRVVKYFTKGAAQSEARATVFKKYKLAENIAEIEAPKMNRGIVKKGGDNNSNNSNKFVASNEKTLYNIQNNVVRSGMAITSVITHVMSKEENNQMINPKDVTTICLEALTLLGYVSKQLSNRRKDNIKNSINEDLRGLCDHERPTTKFLLGDDLSKGSRDAREIAKLCKKNQNKSNRNSSSSSHTSTRDYNYSNKKSYSSQQHQQQSSKPSFLSKGKGKKPNR